MPVLNLYLYLGSLVFQVAAVVFALRMMRTSHFRAPWLIMAISFAFMAAYRSVGLLSSGDHPILNLPADSFASLSATISLTISAILFTSLFAVRRLSDRERQADDARRASEARLRSLIDNTPSAIVVKDLDGRFQLVNKPFTETLGLSADQLIGKRDADFHSSEAAAAFRADDLAVIESRRPTTKEETFEYHGRRLTYVTTKFPLTDDVGRVTGVCGIATEVTDLKRAEADARESNERLRLALDAGHMGIWEWHLGSQRFFWSPSAARIFGLAEPVTESTGDYFSSLIHPDDRRRVWSTAINAVDRRVPFECDFRIVRPDGEVRWVSDRGQTIYGDDGAPLRLLGTITDVTDRVAREQELGESRERLAAALSAGQTGTFRWDMRTSALTWDDNLDHLFGLPPGRTAQSLDQFLAMVHPDDRQGVIDRCARCREEGTDFSMEFRVVWADGSIHWLDDQGKTFVDPEDGRPLYMIGACVDITAGKEQELALRESATRFRELADAMPQIVWTSRPDGTVDYYNRRWRELTGRPDFTGAGAAGGVDPADWAPAVHPDDVPHCVDVQRDAIRTGRGYQIEYRLLDRASGEYRWHFGRVIPVTGEDGRVAQWIGTGTDIHDRKLTEQALRAAREEAEAANRTKDEFLAALSHELRTPLAPVLLSTQLLEHDASLPEHVRADLHNIRKSIEIETRLIDDLLDLTRVARGKLELHLGTVDVHDVIRHSIDTCRDDTFLEKRLTLVADLSARESQVHGDPARLGQIVWNLLKNAVKFTPEAGTITIRTRNEQALLVIEVSDTGIGIAPDVLPHIFNAFEQGGAQITRRFGGLGLGLSITRALTDLHHGTIAARSDGPGKGALFTVELPVLAAAATRPQSSAAAPRVPEFRSAARDEPRNILLVEDHDQTGKIMSRLLSRFGYEVEWAQSVDSALRAAARRRFDLVVSDLGLPDGSGHDLMRQLRRHYGLKGVAISGYGMEQDLDRSARSGFLRHLTKPVTIEKLDAAIRDAFTVDESHTAGTAD